MLDQQSQLMINAFKENSNNSLEIAADKFRSTEFRLYIKPFDSIITGLCSTYNSAIDKKDEEIQLLREEIKSLREELQKLKETPVVE